jgi:hypothetical protein
MKKLVHISTQNRRQALEKGHCSLSLSIKTFFFTYHFHVPGFALMLGDFCWINKKISIAKIRTNESQRDHTQAPRHIDFSLL